MKFAALVGLVAGLWCYHPASGELHSLKYFYTGVSGDVDFPEFTVVGLVDDGQFMYFDSKIKKALPKTDWMKAEGEDYWNQQTQIAVGERQIFANNIQVAKERFNQSHSNGVHTFQNMYGCQWDDESQATDGFFQCGYDGEDFITLDLKNLRYIASTPESLITKNKWDNDRALLEGDRNYLTTECIDWLKKYLQYGSSTLERKVHPEVTLIQKDSAVVCHATGFYPEGVMITLKIDGEEMLDDVDVGETLPNEDGTFQKRAVLTVSPEMKKGQYTCEVAHKSGPPTFKTLIVEDGNNILGIIIGCVVAVAVVTGVIVAIVMMKKKGYKKAEQSDSESDNSNGART